MKGKYVQLFAHVIDGKTVYTKGGTQVIDRTWQHVRRHIMKRSSASSGKRLYITRIRSAQWAYWNMGKDLFQETGIMLADL